MKKAVYAGSFDPVTLGHQNIIDKAASIFDEVHVVIAHNPAKKYDLPLGERLRLLTWMAEDNAMKNVKIVSIGMEFAVSYAKRVGAQFLVRGIRDVFDYSYENTIYVTNKGIEHDIETVYLMPDEDRRVVSSSWVKSLVGFEDWQDQVRKHVSPRVLEVLIEWYLHKRWDALCDKIAAECHPLPRNQMWQEIVQGYSGRPYHNHNHILECLRIADKYVGRPSLSSWIEYALFFHDISETEEASAERAVGWLDNKAFTPLREIAYNLIMATKHITDYYKTFGESFIASIDLAILGVNRAQYRYYMDAVDAEYFGRGISKREYYKGRLEFLKGFEKRKFIYPDETIRNDLEESARNNIDFEIRWLTHQLGLPPHVSGIPA